MKNIIVVGDSYASDSEGWPRTLANELNLNLICYGVGGQPWWNVRNYIKSLSQEIINNTEVIVFAHTNATRIPTLNENIGKIDHSKNPESEIENAVYLYHKYISEQNFLTWAQQQWFEEISRTWPDKKLCHLHCFPWSVESSNSLKGINVITNLTALSLNELNSRKFNLFNDKRTNHFNKYNNIQLGLQVANHLKNYSNKTVELDIGKFDQKTTLWFDKGTNWN